MPNNERSAEWLRGAVESHINTCNLITSITSATESHPARQGLMAANNELHNQLDRYRALLAAAEAREAAPGDSLSTTVEKLREACSGVRVEPPEQVGPSAAEVIEAAEQALKDERSPLRLCEPSCQKEAVSRCMCRRCTSDRTTDALALCARWKEATGGK